MLQMMQQVGNPTHPACQGSLVKHNTIHKHNMLTALPKE